MFANYSFGERRDLVTDTLAPRHKANAGLRWQHGRGGAMLWAHFFDETELFGQSIDDYILLNGSITWRLFGGAGGATESAAARAAEGRAFLRAFNLLDHDHREHPQGQEYGLILTAGFELNW